MVHLKQLIEATLVTSAILGWLVHWVLCGPLSSKLQPVRPNHMPSPLRPVSAALQGHSKSQLDSNYIRSLARCSNGQPKTNADLFFEKSRASSVHIPTSLSSSFPCLASRDARNERGAPTRRRLSCEHPRQQHQRRVLAARIAGPSLASANGNSVAAQSAPPDRHDPAPDRGLVSHRR